MPELKEIALEDVLDRHLGPVAAPEELWRRVHSGSRPPRSRPVSRRWIWTTAFAMVAGGAAWALHPRPNVELRSSSASQLREWVKARTDLDVPLRDSPSVRLIGAHLTNRLTSPAAAVEIVYRAGDHEGTLAVVKSPGSADNHRSVVNESRSGAKLVSWTMRGQAYAVSCDDPDQARAACLLCHS